MNNCIFCTTPHRVELEEAYQESEDIEQVRSLCHELNIPFSKVFFGIHFEQHRKSPKVFKNCPFCNSSIRDQLEEMHRNGSVFSHISRVAKNAGETKISTNVAKEHCLKHTSYVAVASIVEPSEVEVLEPEEDGGSLAVLHKRTIKRLPPFSMDSFVQTTQKAVANLFENHLAICLDLQTRYAAGEIPFPEVEFKYLIALVAAIEKLLNYQTSTDLNCALDHLLAAGYKIVEDTQQGEK